MSGRYEVKKPNAPIDWTVEVPGSKSITNRALLMAALSTGHVRLCGVLFSDDSRYFVKALQDLGYDVSVDEEKKEIEIEGTGGRLPFKSGKIYVGSAGTAARFLTAMLGVGRGTFEIHASGQMQRRPMKSLFESLIALGAHVVWLGQEWHLPVQITGAADRIAEMRGPAAVRLDISESTQFLSALLLSAPMFPHGLEIHVTSKKIDGSYIRITRTMMEQFGVSAQWDKKVYRVCPGAAYKRSVYQIEPDVSAACYFYGAAAVTGGRVLVKNVFSSGMQGDLHFLDVLRDMGCGIKESGQGIVVSGPKDGRLRGISVNMNDFSDQALTLAAIAPYAQEPVEITGIAHIRGQECDRIHAITSNLGRAGIFCEERADGVRIEPGKPAACVIETFDDHRVAMAFSLLGLGQAGIQIADPSCCRKTFERYFEILDDLCQKK